MPKKEITLDEILAKKRRAEASKKATAIMGRSARTTSTNPASASPTNKPWRHDLHHRVNPAASRVSKLPTTLSPTVARSLQNNRLFAALHGDQVEVVRGGSKATATGKKGGVNIKGVAKTGDDSGLSIKGSAGPAVVQASNFAPGTTAEDIRHVFEPLGKITSCIILTATPTVIAEIVFERKEAGEKCIQMYNGEKADGRTLHVFFKNTPSIALAHQQLQNQLVERDPFLEREEADRRRREQNIHFQDGRYGVRPPPMYSDALIQKGRGFSH
ncbi:hypothetical protein FN846DRAFT_943483 [Sphaerosporella brunnea]|uniref:RRM domain-containing protein n=1 Tax=Sphaerosporella brunnea TaxID=1250544 RepID=A0A5J5F0Y0_9PEZI|nr:hypothetical protein FN846DRAFT_943483 [Sphaerosporella brunnea]